MGPVLLAACATHQNQTVDGASTTCNNFQQGHRLERASRQHLGLYVGNADHTATFSIQAAPATVPESFMVCGEDSR
jgi:hypothetical protein